jgi:ATP-dependent DNA helicase RecG
MKSPEADVLDGPAEALVTGRIVPVHPGVKGVSPGVLRRAIHNALARSLPVADPLPPDMVDRLKLVTRSDALRQIHFPDDLEEVPAARRRLVFDELFRLQLALGLRKRRLVDEGKGVAHRLVDNGLADRFLDGLPFAPTPAQRRVIDEISADLGASHPMHRLLLGDVGSGKTVVAVAAILLGIDGGFQGAVMAPTEVLAVQHFISISSLLAGAGMAPPLEAGGMSSMFEGGGHDRPVRVGLITGSTAEVNFRDEVTREELLGLIAAGEIEIAIGTHALIQEGVAFASLGVAVVDEQHRFGVHQRIELRQKGNGHDPDLLIMTATPIPRTLSMTLYGDLDVSSIGPDEMPEGRPRVFTEAVPPGPAGEAIWAERINAEVALGHQAFIVCPLVEDSPKVEAASATSEYERLRAVFPDHRLGLLHGQMRPKDKAMVMEDFRDRRIDILVATTVIEVGIDIPHSTVMVIQDADRFGLSQLHQLRGRLSRGVGPNYCFLSADPSTDEGASRVAAMVATDDGFRLAEEDLRIRGEGTLFGARQAGTGDLRIASLLRDGETLVQARREAFDLIDADPQLAGHPGLREEVGTFLGEIVDWLLIS